MILQIASASKKDNINSTNEARFPYIRSAVCCKNSAVTDTINIAQISWLKIVEIPHMYPSVLRRTWSAQRIPEWTYFLFGKQISCLFLTCTGKDKAETYFLVITPVKTRGRCQHSHRCCLVTVVLLPPPLCWITGNQGKAGCSLHLEWELDESAQFWCSWPPLISC